MLQCFVGAIEFIINKSSKRTRKYQFCYLLDANILI